ncbi:cupin domain-containing protein [Gammaproteobacteria bacterium]|nr:cupin domain-containing protein [Gammaproteobacteria bacterium]
MILGNISVDTFLKEYWQQKPLLIKQAFPDFKDPVSPEELAGLACEEEAESRIVFTNGDNWTLKNGPFLESDFTSLPEQDWTLLVQAVDHWFPSVQKLINNVPFIPRWRIDDVMVSYAEKNAGVGPHFDYYDVFIIQGQGSRRWKIGQSCNSQTELISDSGLKILKDFIHQEEYELNNGDVLYIPPGIAHYGISNNSSLSYSIGFRAPSVAEILINYSDEICANLNDDQRYKDSILSASPNATGEIATSALNTVTELINNSINNPAAINTWFGKYMTEAKTPESILAPEELLSPDELHSMLMNDAAFYKHPAARFAWINSEDCLRIFCNGEEYCFDLSNTTIQSLNTLLNSSEDTLELQHFLHDPDCLTLLVELYNQGSILSINEE